MTRATVSAHIDASAGKVFTLYADPANWPRIFPAIRAVRILNESPEERVVEVDHVSEGKVLNVLRTVSETRIDLEEVKRRYDASFVNRIEPEAGGTRYTLSAEIRLKGFYRLAGPFLKPLVRARMRRHVLAPMKMAAEKDSPAGSDRMG